MKRFSAILTLLFTTFLGATASFAQTPTPTAVNGMCKRVLAYYTSWSSGSYNASMVPYAKLTHICYAFVTPNTDGSLNGTSGGLYMGGSLNSDCTSLVANAHANNVKVLISVGGAGVPGSRFSTLMASGAAVTNFVNNLYGMAVTNNFDGVDIDWEYPASNADKANFLAFTQALRNKFNGSPVPAPNWLITAAVSPGYLTQYLDLPNLKNSMTFFNVMTYDYHGSWTNHSGHVGGLFQATGDVGHNGSNGMAAITYYTGQGVPASQINYGFAFYGYGFDTGSLFGSCACNTTSIPYSQVVPLIGNGWTRYWDNSSPGPYLLPTSGGASVICYDDPPSVLATSNYVLNNSNVGGVFMWALNHDYLGPGNQPLLNAMVQMASLCGSPTPTPFQTYTPIPTSTPTYTPTPWVSSVFRVNAGGPAYTDTQSNLWVADSQYSGGSLGSVNTAITGTSDQTLYKSERWGNFTYTFNVLPGTYQVTLKFAEIYFNSVGQRIFNVAINGVTVLTSFDIVADAGGAFKADDKVFNNINPNGSNQIVIQFLTGAMDLPKVSALQIIPMPPTPTPTFTPTATFTACMVNGTPCTSTATSTFTFTPTSTPTPPAGFKSVIWPNPVKDNGPALLHIDLPQVTDVKVRVYTTAFRKLREDNFPQVAAGTTDLPILIQDKYGSTLANGLYYVMVDAGGDHKTLKWLIFR